MDEGRAAVEGETRIGAATVRWRRQGSGPAIVLLHGFPLSGRTWDGVALRLRERFTCYAPDLVGLGGSCSTSAGDYASQGQARVLQALLATLGVGRYALAGNDTGGWVARELALVDRARVTHLVLTNTEIPRHRPPWIPTYQLLARAPGFATLLRGLLGSRAFRRSPLGFGGCFHDLGLLDGEFHEVFVAPLLASHERRLEVARFLREMRFARLDEFATLHGQLTMPTLLVWGADDPTFPEPRAREMTAQLPEVAGFHAVRDAKLYVQQERPDEVAELIGDFLGARPARA